MYFNNYPSFLVHSELPSQHLYLIIFIFVVIELLNIWNVLRDLKFRAWTLIYRCSSPAFCSQKLFVCFTWFSKEPKERLFLETDLTGWSLWLRQNVLVWGVNWIFIYCLDIFRDFRRLFIGIKYVQNILTHEVMQT